VGSSKTELGLPRRADVLLFVLSEAPGGYVATELKLQKLVFQVQYEAKVLGYDFSENLYGPYSQELNLDTFTANNIGLIERDKILGVEHSYWMFKITDLGKRYFTKSVLPQLDEENIERMRRALSQYAKLEPHALAEHVYRQYGIKDAQRLNSELQGLIKDLEGSTSFWETQYFPKCPFITYYLAYLEYSHDALEKVASVTDTVVKSVLVRACRELDDRLERIAEVCSKNGVCPAKAETDICPTPDPSVHEIFDFIQEFCEQKGVLPKMLNRDLKELVTGDEYERLQKALQNLEV